MKKVFLISADKIGKNMAGPGVRYFEMAKILSRYFNLTLLAPDDCDVSSKDFKILSYDSSSASASIGKLITTANVVIAQNLRPPLLHRIKKLGIRYIADLYDPLTIETLEQIKYEPKNTQKNAFDAIYYIQALQLECADHILCASDRQRDFYIGTLFGRKIISPKIYNDSADFKHIVSLAPFGLAEKEPEFTDPNMIYRKFPQIKPNDKIILWGGGIWNWFDPLSVIEALEKISAKRNDVKLVFMGMKHPNPKIKQMKMSQKTLDYCNKNDLTNKLVFFNHDWVPYSDRVNYLLSASIGISTHFDNLETRFSFRTRILDYLWANLPMIVTEGDFMADFVKDNNLGKVVRYKNVADISEAIINVLEKRKVYSKNIKEEKKRFFWDNSMKDLVSVIKEEKYFSRKKSFEKFASLTFKYYIAGYKYGK